MKQQIKRIIVYLIGLWILSLGVAVSVKSGLGVTSVNSIPYALSLIFSADMGLFTAGLYIVFVLIQALLLRRKFPKRYLLEIPCSVLFGEMVDLSNLLLTLLPDPSHYILRLLLLAASILLVASGVYLYCQTNLIPLPGDGVILALAETCNIKFHTVKILFDCVLVVISAIISMIFLHGLVSVREGTVISSILIGTVVGVLPKLFGKRSAGVKSQ